MAVALQSLRVTADMDATGYARGAAIKLQADAQMIDADKRMNASMAQAQAAMDKAIPGFNTLAKSLLQGYSAGQQFEAQIRRVGNSVDQGLGLDKATALLEALYRKFGLVADAAVLARQGFVSIVPTINDMNKAVATYEEQVRRADLVTRAFAESQGLLSRQAANQNQINSQLGVNLGGNSGDAKASADAFLSAYGGLDGVAKEKAEQIGKAFTDELNERLIAGVGSSARESASVFEETFNKLDAIAQARAAHFAQEVQLGWSQAFNMSGAGIKSAQDSASVFEELEREERAAAQAAAGLRAQIDPLGVEFATLGKQLAVYRQLLRDGKISTQEFEQANALAAKRLSDVEQNLKKGATAGRVMSGEMVNLGYQVNDVLTGLALGQSPFMILAQQGGQIYQIFQNSKASIADFAKTSMNWFTSLFTASRVAFGGVAAAILIAVSALISFQSKQTEVERQLSGMGRASGATSGGIDAIAQQNSSLGGLSPNEARNLAAALAATGKVGVDAIGPIVALGHDFAKTYGVDAKEAAQILAQAFADPAKGADDLNQRLGFLDANTRLLIDSLVVQGNRQEAVRVLTDALKTSLRDAADVTSIWGRAWTVTGNIVSSAFDQIGRGAAFLTGSAEGSLQEELNRLTIELLALQKAKIEGGFFNWFTQGIDPNVRIAELNAQLDKLSKQRTAQQPTPETGDKQRGLEIDAIARAAVPAIEQTRKLEDQTKALNQAYENPAIGKWVSIVGGDLVRALQRSKAAADASKGFDSVTNQIADSEQQIKLIDKHTIADRAAAAAASEKRRQQSDPNAGTPEERLRKQGLAALQAAGGQTALDNVEKQRLSTLGSMATVTDRVRMHQLDLTEAGRAGAGVTETQAAAILKLTREQELGITQMKAQADSTRIQSDTWGMSAGAAAAYAAAQNRIAEARRNNQALSPQDLADINAEAAALGKTTEAAAKLAIQKQIKYDQGNLFVSNDSLKIAQQLEDIYGKDVPKALASTEAAQLRVLDLQKDLSTGFHDVGQSMFTAFLSGKNVMDAMVQSLDNVAKKLADKAFDNILEGVMTGNLAQAGVGVAQAGASALISVFTGDQKAKKELAAAQAEWKAAGPAFETFLRQMSGGATGTMTAAFNSLYQQVQDFVQKAAKAEDQASVNRAYAGFNENVLRTTAAFRQSFGGMLDAINAGLGPDSPFSAAANNVKSVGETLKQFIDDATTAYANDAIARAAGNAPEAGREGGGEAQIAAATAAAQQYLLTLLGQPVVLSETATAIQKMQGTAVQLKATLAELGMSSEQAAASINAGVIAAMQQLADNFSASLTARLNTANGQSYLNDTVTLLKQHQQDIADAASLGLDQAAVASVFHAEAQKIVNDAGLVGDAFTEFTNQFPDLASVVTEASDAVADAVKQQQAALNGSAKSIVDYIAGITTGSNSTLSPTDRLNAAQQAYNAKLVLAQSGNVDAQGSITSDAENLRTALRDMYGSTAAYQQAVSAMTSQLLNLPAVQQTDDPVVMVMRDVLTAINAGIATQATDATLVGTVTAAINAGNAAATATALSTYFNKIDTNTSQSIDFSEMQAALGNMASNAALRNMFTTLDNDNSGSIDRLELIKAASQATNSSTAQTAAQAVQTNSLLNSANSLSNSAIGLASAANDIGNYSASLLSSINGLQSTSSQQLNILNTQYGQAPVQALLGAGLVVTANNTMISALNKIVLNTYATAMNTGGGNHIGGVYAQGGYHTGPGTSTSDSIPIWVSTGEATINAAAMDRLGGRPAFEQLNAGRMPVIPVPVPVRAGNDNGAGGWREMAAELKSLRQEVARFRTENNQVTAAAAAHVGETFEASNEKTRIEAAKQARRKTAN